MILVIDYNMGNVGSIVNMLHHLGIDDVKVSSKIGDIIEADRYILPGVGAFDTGMTQLNELGIVCELKKQVIENKKPLLGICLGMQLLGRRSDEGQEIQGLNLIPFDVVRFSERLGVKVPHMGWDYVTIQDKEDLLVNEMLDESQRFYFVHSFYVVCDRENDVLMKCDYGVEFVAAVRYENIYGVQFHPEKSHKYGMKLLENFVKM